MPDIGRLPAPGLVEADEAEIDMGRRDELERMMALASLPRSDRQIEMSVVLANPPIG